MTVCMRLLLHVNNQHLACIQGGGAAWRGDQRGEAGEPYRQPGQCVPARQKLHHPLEWAGCHLAPRGHSPGKGFKTTSHLAIVMRASTLCLREFLMLSGRWVYSNRFDCILLLQPFAVMQVKCVHRLLSPFRAHGDLEYKHKEVCHVHISPLVLIQESVPLDLTRGSANHPNHYQY
jgi:hypothetical protein